MPSSITQVGRSYGRVVLYCSNFERTTADALFFESLLCLARMVVAAAVAEPSLAPEVRGWSEENAGGSKDIHFPAQTAQENTFFLLEICKTPTF